MADNLRADSSAIQKTANEVSGIVGDMKSTLSALTNEVQQAASFWKGSASTKFAAAMAEWNRIGKDLENSLDEMSNNLSSNSKHYAAAEEANANQFGGLNL